METVLYPSKAKHAGMLAVSLLFVAGGIWIGARGLSIGYVCSAFFALCASVFVIQKLPGASHLRLAEDYFEFSSLFRRSRYQWIDVSNFGIITQWQIGAKDHQMIGWNFVSKNEGRGIWRSLSRSISGMEAGLPDTYGLPIDELLQVMQRYRRLAHKKQNQVGAGDAGEAV